jgi:hypothetical protein
MAECDVADDDVVFEDDPDDKTVIQEMKPKKSSLRGWFMMF